MQPQAHLLQKTFGKVFPKSNFNVVTQTLFSLLYPVYRKVPVQRNQMELRNKHLWMEKHKLFVQSVNICNGLANYLLLDLYKWKQELENNSRYLCYNSYIQKGSPQFSPSPKQISPIFYSEELKENVFQNILV
jgi:hypothetical protein